jgi:hypothetical protein
MKYIPIDIVNYICEFAADKNKLWFPFFSPKTGQVSWMVNPHCVKYITLSRKFLNRIRMVDLTFYNVKTVEEEEMKCKTVVFNTSEYYIQKMYIEINTNDDKFTIRGMISVMNHYMREDDLYLNETPYANISYGWSPSTECKRITIGYEIY